MKIKFMLSLLQEYKCVSTVLIRISNVNKFDYIYTIIYILHFLLFFYSYLFSQPNVYY